VLYPFHSKIKVHLTDVKNVKLVQKCCRDDNTKLCLCAYARCGKTSGTTWWPTKQNRHLLFWFFYYYNKFITESHAYTKLQKLNFWIAVICAWFTLRYFSHYMFIIKSFGEIYISRCDTILIKCSHLIWGMNAYSKNIDLIWLDSSLKNQRIWHQTLFQSLDHYIKVSQQQNNGRHKSLCIIQ
jgi:hypothetical protein